MSDLTELRFLRQDQVVFCRASRDRLDLMRTDLSALRSDLAEVKAAVADLAAIKTSVSDLAAIKASAADLGSIKSSATSLAADLGAMRPKLTNIDDSTAAAKTRLAGVLDVQTAQGRTEEQPLHVQGVQYIAPDPRSGPTGSSTDPQYVSFSPSAATQVDDGGKAIVGAIFVLVGLTVALVFLRPLLRLVMPGREA